LGYSDIIWVKELKRSQSNEQSIETAISVRNPLTDDGTSIFGCEIAGTEIGDVDRL
jgi:hypothetical protein